MDYRAMFEGKYLGAWNLIDDDGNRRDVRVTIESVSAQQIVGEGGKQNKKPVLKFRGKDLPMVAGKTVAKVIAGMYGNDTKGWIGKDIVLYPTQTQVGGDTKDCIRVRPTVPTSKATAPAARQPGED
jgi:hypothetical protein